MKRFVFILLLFTSLLYSKEKLRPYRLINADSLLVQKKAGFYHTDLAGNVHFFYGNTEFYCDNAVLDEEKKLTVMQGNVRVYEDTLSLFANNGEYHRKEEKIYLNNNVKIVQQLPDSTKNIFFAQHITYIRLDSILIAQDRVKAISQKEKIEAECGYLKYNLKKHYGYLKRNPIIKKNEKGKILSATAEKMEYFDDYKKIVANFNVKTDFEDYKIRSDFMIYFSNEEKAIVVGNPVFIAEQANTYAKQFIFKLEKNKLKNATLLDSCKVFYKIDKEDSIRTNYVFADKMKLFFDEGKLQKMTALGNVKTFYIQKKKKKQDFAKNYVIGDSLFFMMDSEKIKYIYLKNPRKGKYYFEK